MHRTFDVRAVREQFPALERKHQGRGVVYFDGPGGSQVARQAISYAGIRVATTRHRPSSPAQRDLQRLK